jgi:arylsulfatase A-like enzyme
MDPGGAARGVAADSTERIGLLRRGRRLGAVGLLLLAAAQLGCARNPQPSVPLVLVVVFDALRADHLSQYGYALPTSPGLDRLAETGSVFLRAYAPTSYTTASTASILTGQSPLRHGTRRQGARLDASIVTLAELVSAEGFVTRGISFNPVVAHATGFAQGFDDFVEREHGSPFNLYPDIERGLERIRGWLAEPEAGPRFVYFQPMNTHGPYLVPESSQKVLLGRPPRAGFRYYDEPMAQILGGNIERRAEVTPAYVASASERYDTAIRYSTDALGAFLDELERAGLYDDALIVVTADHGDELFEHGGFSHGYSLYEEVIHVPLFVKLPRQRSARRIDTRVSVMDVFATVADVVGARVPEAVEGRSLVPLARGSGELEPEPLHLLVDFPPRLDAHGILDGRHKLIAIESNYEGARRKLRLYDLLADPAERSNLAESRPELVAALLEELGRGVRRYELASALPSAPLSDELDLERLRALGYAE